MTSAEITSNIIAAISLIVSLGSAVYAGLAYRLSMRQDSRRSPALVFIDVNGYVSYAQSLARVVKRMSGLGNTPYQFRFFM